MESMIKASVTRAAAFAMGSTGYLPDFDLSLGGNAARSCATGVLIAPNALDVQGWSGFSGMIMVEATNERPVQLPVLTSVQAQKAQERHPEILAPYLWRPPA